MLTGCEMNREFFLKIVRSLKVTALDDDVDEVLHAGNLPREITWHSRAIIVLLPCKWE
ncbi:MAG: hypothetical protein ACTSVI_06220 [Promethearchaeota archaeon]